MAVITAHIKAKGEVIKVIGIMDMAIIIIIIVTMVPIRNHCPIIKVMANHKQIPTTVIKGKITTITTATEVTNGIEITIIKIINPQIPILAEETIVPIITCLLSQ